MKRLATAVGALLLSANLVHAGQLSPGLERLITGKNAQEEIKVLVSLREQAAVQVMDADLHAAKAPFAQRHRAVVDELRDTAFRSQTSLLGELEERAASGAGGVRGYTPYWIVNAVTVVGTVQAVRELATHPSVDVIEPDLQVELIQPIESDPEKSNGLRDLRGIGITPGVVSIQARRVWQELGITGVGAIVGNMDTGVDGAHPALSARWRGNFAPAAHCWRDAVGFGDATPVDRHYHGTHVMGTITGLAPDDTIGVAPGALWIADNTINQSTGSAFDNDVISGLQWFADPDGNSLTTDDVPDVVQNSWGVNEGFSGYFDCDSRWWAAIDNCEAAGVVLTWSAGNEGPGGTSLRSPADRAASPFNSFSVGSTIATSPFTISSFSSRGPSGCGGAFAVKPEVCAPGSDIYSAEPGGTYQLLSGTSMAGPHVAGVVALMRSANPDLDVQTIKQILMDTAVDLGTVGEDNTYGHGFIDAYEAVLAVLSGYGKIEGTVTSALGGAPIVNATVDVLADPRSVVTDGTGFFRVNLPAGSYTLEYSAFGHVTQQVPYTVTADQTTNGDVVMTPVPQAILSGVVRDYTNAVVAGATVTVLGTPLAPVVTLANGSYSISVPDGATYNVQARKNGLGADTRSVVVSGPTTQDFVLPELSVEDFESGDLTVWPWVTSGNAPWTVTTSPTFEGTYAARSGVIGDGQSSTMELNLYFSAAGDVTFYYNVSSEATYDFLRFFIDGIEQGAWSGSVPWTLATYAVGAGSHTLRWTYSKDGSLIGGSDAAYVDSITFPPVAVADIAVTPSSLNVSVPTNGTAQRLLTVSNDGGAPLNFSVSVDDSRSLVPPREVAVEGEPPVLLAKGATDDRVGVPPVLGSGGPDSFGYRWIDSNELGGPTYQWVEISGVGTPLTMADDTFTAALPMGISMSFYGNVYNSVHVSSNGFVGFNAGSATFHTNTVIPDATDPDNIVAAYWDDLNPADGGTIYTFQDVANSRFIVEWNAVPRYNTGGSQPQTFQIILNANGTIVTQYKTVSNQTSCTVGVENANGSVGLQTVFNASYLQNNLAVRVSVDPPVAWLTVSPLSGSLTASGTIDLTADFDATGLADGTYNAVVHVSSNDPDEAMVNVPVTMIVGGATDVVLPGAVPTRFELSLPQPNPFATAARVRFAVPNSGTLVSLEIYDVAGRLVRTLVDGPMPAGQHSIVWDGHDDAGRRSSAGIYFVKMNAAEFSQVHKVTFLK